MYSSSSVTDIDAALYCAVFDGNVAAVERLLAAGADANCSTIDFRQQSPLHIARNLDIARILVQHGANIDVSDAHL
jgi:ankyrin repeat protein